MNPRDTIARERTENTAGWRYEIQHGPDGETSYAWVYDDQNAMVCTAETHHAIAIVQRMNAAAGYRIVGPADMEAVVVPKLTGQMIEAAYQASPIYELSQKWQRHEGVMRSGDFSYEFLRMWDAAHAASPHMPVPAEWRPIETAPKEKHVIVVSKRFPDPHEGFQYSDGWKTWGANGTYTDDPTMWQPLPAAPKPAALTQEPKPAEGEK